MAAIIEKAKDVLGGNKDNDDNNHNRDRRRGDEREYSDFSSGRGYDRDYRSYDREYGAGAARAGHHSRTSPRYEREYDVGRSYDSYGGGHGGGYTTSGRTYDRYGDAGYGSSRFGDYDRSISTFGDNNYGSGYVTGRTYDRSLDSSYGGNSGYTTGRNYDRGYGYGGKSLSSSYANNDTYSTGSSGFANSGFAGSGFSSQTGLSGFNPVVDLTETEKEWHVHAELPGVDKSNVHVTCDNAKLTISGERARQKDDGGRTYHKVERSYGKFTRSLTLPMNVENKDIKANFKDGVLEVSIPKPAAYLNRRIPIA